MPSLDYFKAEFSSLTSPHPITWTPASNPYEVTKAVVQAKMLSGRYRTAKLTSHWTNRGSDCQAPGCNGATETLEHILVSCPYYADTRQRLVNLWISIPDPTVKMLALSVLTGPSQQLVSFILDASSHPLVIKAGKNLLSAIFYLTRTWCYSIHRKRAKLLCIYSFD